MNDAETIANFERKFRADHESLRRYKRALETIAAIGEASRTVNSLPHPH